jgi:L-fuculose-phosphate aldolase
MAVPEGTLWELQQVGADLYRAGLVSSHGGNLSIRDGHGMWITGTGTMLGRLETRHISYVSAGGQHEGPPPSSDTVLHSTIYALGGAQAIVHAHPHHAIAIAYGRELFVPGDLEGQMHLGDVPVVPASPTATESIAHALQSRLVVVLEGHGAYARGQTIWEALHWITALEESAHISWLRQAMER